MNALSVPFRPFARSETYGSLLFFAASAPVGAAALGLLIGGWVAAGVLLVTPLVVVVLLAFRGAVGLLSAGDAALARGLLGTTAAPRVRSGGTGFWRRWGHAVRGTILTRTDSGGETLSTWRIGSAYGAAYLSNQWYPDRLNTARLDVIQGSVTLGFDLIGNLGSEFWPDIKRKVLRRK